MFEYLSLEFEGIRREFLNQQESQENSHSNFIFITIQNIPSLTQANDLISQEWFKLEACSSQQLICINLNINEALNEDCKCKPFEQSINGSAIVTFQSTIEEHASRTFWKVLGRESFHSLYIDEDETEEVVKFVHKFLIKEIKSGNSGIMNDYEAKDDIHIQDLGTSSNTNLLMLAAQEIEINVIKKLLTNEFDIDDENNDHENAIDKAWTAFLHETTDTASLVLLCLLKANSKLPRKFQYNSAPKDVQNFVGLCENLHKNVNENDFKTIDSKVKEHPNLIYFYSRHNKSLAAHAFIGGKFDKLDALNLGVCPGLHEKLDLSKSHILVLRSKTKIASNDQLHQFRWRCVKDAYETLDADSFCSLLLQVTAQVKSIKIFFDFKHDSVYYLDPMKKITVLGTTYSGGTMYIGAKQLLDDSTKYIVLSTLSHELCHLAVLVTYMNPNFDPFPLGESNIKEMFMNEVMTESREKMKDGDIVSNAFTYAKELQASELIVTVAEALMHFYNDPKKIEEVEGIHEKLFKYAKEVVEPEMKEALPVLCKLGDSEINIRYDSLTETMKQSISHLPITFQGAKTTFNELFGDDDSCLNLLSADNIRDLLLTGKGIQISSICKLNPKYALIERHFMNRETYQYLKTAEIQEYESRVNARSKSIMRIRKNTSKTFVLADYAGTGKTTVFKDAALKIKSQQRNFWVSYVNLRKYGQVLLENEPKLGKLTRSDVMEVLCCMVGSNLTELEKKIFKKLFERNQVVLFLDGVDEVCPRYTDIMMDIFTKLKRFKGSNELWISTRPHYAARIGEIFGVLPITFVLYTMKQKVKFIKEILTKNGITDEVEQINGVGQINAFIFLLNWEPCYFSDPDHPLIIEIIAELYVEKREIKLDASSHYALYAAMIDKQKEKVGDKIPNVERDPFSSLSVWHAHQVLAILVIIGELYDKTFTYKLPDGSYYKEGFRFELEKLAMIEAWRTEIRGGRWTSDMIQRYGFVTVNLDNLMENRSCIEFSHRTYAEFFVAQFLIDFLFNKSFNEREMIKMMNILEIVQGTPNLVNVSFFIFSFMRTVALKEKRQFHPLIRMYFRKRIWEALIDKDPLTTHADPFIFFSKIVVCDDELTQKLWRLKSEHDRNSFEIIITHENFTFLDLIIDTAAFVFGENWHETFNKSGTKLISNDKIEAMRDKVVDSWEDWRKEKNLLKFCDYLHKNFDADVQRTIHDKMVHAFLVTNDKVLMEIVRRMSDIYDKEGFIKKCIGNIFIKGKLAQSVMLIFQLIEEHYAADRSEIRRILFEDLCGDDLPLCSAIYTRKIQLFLFIKDLYLKYQDSLKEVQNIIMGMETFDILKYAVASELYEEFKSFCMQVFQGNMGAFKAKFLDYISSDLYNIEDYSENIEDFINFVVFSD